MDDSGRKPYDVRLHLQNRLVFGFRVFPIQLPQAILERPASWLELPKAQQPRVVWIERNAMIPYGPDKLTFAEFWCEEATVDFCRRIAVGYYDVTHVEHWGVLIEWP